LIGGISIGFQIYIIIGLIKKKGDAGYWIVSVIIDVSWNKNY